MRRVTYIIVNRKKTNTVQHFKRETWDSKNSKNSGENCEKILASALKINNAMKQQTNKFGIWNSRRDREPGKRRWMKARSRCTWHVPRVRQHIHPSGIFSRSYKNRRFRGECRRALIIYLWDVASRRTCPTFAIVRPLGRRHSGFRAFFVRLPHCLLAATEEGGVGGPFSLPFSAIRHRAIDSPAIIVMFIKTGEQTRATRGLQLLPDAHVYSGGNVT